MRFLLLRTTIVKYSLLRRYLLCTLDTQEENTASGIDSIWLRYKFIYVLYPEKCQFSHLSNST